MSTVVRCSTTFCLFGILSFSSWAAEPAAPGLSHFYQVNDHLYRGAQPSPAGWSSLAQMGVKLVIDLCREGETGGHSTAAERKAVEAAGMSYVNIPMNGIVAPGDEKISRVLTLLNSNQHVFVHCRHGKDRTGTVIACYRIAHDGWTNKQALDEAVSLGLHRVEFGMRRYIENYHCAVALKAPDTAAGVIGKASQN